jgi:replication initiation protein RepC
MHMGSITTPFGRRPMTLALVRRQRAMAEIKAGKTADKWKVFRDMSAAFDKLGLQSNTLAVLDALLSFYPESVLRQDAQMIVFPSNLQLCLRAHSMAGATLRRHLAILVETGLILRKDSANGKRYARKGKGGSIESAFGFDLSPLLARADEIAILAQEVAAERATFRKAKENLTVCRRDIRKLISAAIEEGAEGDWQAVEDIYVSLVARIPRTPSLANIVALLDEMEMLHAEVLNMLELQSKDENKSTNAALNEQHIQNSNPESTIDFELGSRTEHGAKSSGIAGHRSQPLKAFPLGLVLKACPSICDYGPGGEIGSWRDIMSAAVVVRSMLGVSPSAYQDACSAMGPENAAVAVACILERASFITSAGGYLRDLTRRTERGEFSLGPMIMALFKANGEAGTERVGVFANTGISL